jgi:hypothetical protein
MSLSVCLQHNILLGVKVEGISKQTIFTSTFALKEEEIEEDSKLHPRETSSGSIMHFIKTKQEPAQSYQTNGFYNLNLSFSLLIAFLLSSLFWMVIFLQDRQCEGDKGVREPDKVQDPKPTAEALELIRFYKQFSHCFYRRVVFF